MNTQETINLTKRPDSWIDPKKEFNIQSNIQVKGFTSKTKWVPEIDHAYVFDKATTLSTCWIPIQSKGHHPRLSWHW